MTMNNEQREQQMMAAADRYADEVCDESCTGAQVAETINDAYNDCADVLERYVDKYHNGWHPGSELPEKPTSKLGRVVILALDGKLYFNYYVDGWDMSNVKWWCYPPKED